MNRMTLIEKGCNASSSSSNSPTPQPKNVYTTSSPSAISDSSPNVDDRRRLFSGTTRRPSFLNSVRDYFHPRSGSLGDKMFRRSEPFRRVQVKECNVQQVYDLRDHKDNFYDDEAAFRRPRSNSSDFLILRKTSRPLSVNVVGLIDQQTDPYRQYMKVVDIYELCPPVSNIIVVDDKVTARKAFSILREHSISSLLVWDSEKDALSSILTLTDFLTCLRNEKKSGEEYLVQDILSGNQLVCVELTTKILDTCEEMRQNRLHRVAVRDEIGNVVSLITVRRVLAAIHKQNRSLHFAQWLSRPIGVSSIGTWDAINCVLETATVMTAMEEMIGFGYSTMPVVDEHKNVIGVITKQDICKTLPLDHPNPREWMTSTKLQDILEFCKRKIFISSKDTIGSVLDNLLNGHAHTAFVLHNQKAIGAVSLSDILAYLLRSPLNTHEEEMPTPSSSGGSSTENIRTFSK